MVRAEDNGERVKNPVISACFSTCAPGEQPASV
jgi:hypothetical protein